MNTLRKLLRYPITLVYVALVVHSRRRLWLAPARKVLTATWYAGVVLALAASVVCLAAAVAVVPY